MTFETEYQLQEFRAIQAQYFDEDSIAFTGIYFDLNMSERMLKLINQMESEIKELEVKLKGLSDNSLFDFAKKTAEDYNKTVMLLDGEPEVIYQTVKS